MGWRFRWYTLLSHTTLCSPLVPYSDTTKPASKTGTCARRFRCWGCEGHLEHELAFRGRGAHDLLCHLSIPTGQSIHTDQSVPHLDVFAFRNTPSLDMRHVKCVVDAHAKQFRCLPSGERKSPGTVGDDAWFALDELFTTDAAATVAHQHLREASRAHTVRTREGDEGNSSEAYWTRIALHTKSYHLVRDLYQRKRENAIYETPRPRTSHQNRTRAEVRGRRLTLYDGGGAAVFRSWTRSGGLGRSTSSLPVWFLGIRSPAATTTTTTAHSVWSATLRVAVYLSRIAQDPQSERMGLSLVSHRQDTPRARLCPWAHGVW